MSPRTPTPIDAEVGKRIRTLRRSMRMTQTALANRLGITFQQVQKYEKGASRVSVSRLMDIAKALDVETAVLIPEEDVVSKPHSSEAHITH